jgi:hypothetical protein
MDWEERELIKRAGKLGVKPKAVKKKPTVPKSAPPTIR